MGGVDNGPLGRYDVPGEAMEAVQGTLTSAFKRVEAALERHRPRQMLRLLERVPDIPDYAVYRAFYRAQALALLGEPGTAVEIFQLHVPALASVPDTIFVCRFRLNLGAALYS